MGQENLGKQIREGRFLRRFMKGIEEEMGFSKGFLGVHTLRKFSKTRRQESVVIVVWAKIS